MTIAEAYLKLDQKKTSLNNTGNMQENLDRCDKILEKLKGLAADYPNYQVPTNLKKDIEGLDIYDKVKINALEADVRAFLNQPKEAIDKAKEAIKEAEQRLYHKNSNCKNMVKFFLILMIVIAVGMAVAVICGIINGGEWAGIVATILGTVDFVMGILSFSWERISDMEVKSVRTTMGELDKAITDRTEKVEEIERKLNGEVKNIKMFNMFNFGFFNKNIITINNKKGKDEDNED